MGASGLWMHAPNKTSLSLSIHSSAQKQTYTDQGPASHNYQDKKNIEQTSLPIATVYIYILYIVYDWSAYL